MSQKRKSIKESPHYEAIKKMAEREAPVKKHTISYIIFLKRNFDKKEVHEWCNKNGFTHNVIEVLEDRYIVPQGDKEVVTIPQGRGIYFT